MVNHEEEAELSVVNEDSHGFSASVASKRRSDEGCKEPAAVTGINLYRLVAVSFGLLCILQAALNVSLHISLFFQANNLTEERDELMRINFDIEARLKNLTEERNELNRTIYDIEVVREMLTDERDYLEQMLNDSALQQNTLTRERDELQTQLNIYALQQNALTRERDELKTKLNDFAHYSNQGWEYFRGSFYFISSSQNNWQNSRADCLRRGADLMIINSDQEQEFTRKIRNKMWIGLSDRETEGRWKWVDGTPVTINYWHPGEPNNKYGKEDCGQINFFDNKKSWNDAPCDSQNFWICEKIKPL